MRMKLAYVALLIGVPAPSAIAQEPPPALYLTCGGGGNANHRNSNSATAFDSQGNTATITGSSTTVVGYADQVVIDLRARAARILLPRSILPRLHGGEDGWFELRDVLIRQNEITATAAVNFMNHPKVRIDRISGVVAIDGKGGSFTGRCVASDPNTPRAF